MLLQELGGSKCVATARTALVVHEPYLQFVQLGRPPFISVPGLHRRSTVPESKLSKSYIQGELQLGHQTGYKVQCLTLNPNTRY